MHRTQRITNSLLELTTAAAALALASLLLAACGGSSSSTTTTAGTPSASTGGSASGTTPSTPATSPTAKTPTAKPPMGKGTSTVKTPAPPRLPARPAAGNATRNILRNGAFKAALTKFAECMRGHKVSLPNPNTSGHGPIFKRGAVNPATPQFRAAQVACLSVLRSALSGVGHAGGAAKAKR